MFSFLFLFVNVKPKRHFLHRLQYDLQQYQGRAHKLEQQRSNSPRGLHLSHSEETFYPNYDGHGTEKQREFDYCSCFNGYFLFIGNWESLTERLALPNNHNVS